MLRLEAVVPEMIGRVVVDEVVCVARPGMLRLRPVREGDPVIEGGMVGRLGKESGFLLVVLRFGMSGWVICLPFERRVE